MMKVLLLTMIPLFVVHCFAQNTEILDKNNISLIASDDGQLFNDMNGNAAYEFPKGSGKHLIYNSSLWFGATDINGQLRTAVEQYNSTTENDLFPGPYSTNSSYYTIDYFNEYNPAIWKVSSADIDAHINDFAANGSVSNPHPSLLSWPGNGDASLGTAPMLAPFVDLNGDGIYDPYAGDYPSIKGCEALYIILNDAVDTTGVTQTPPMNIEVHIMLYQFATNDFLNYITFMDTRVINRGTGGLYDFVFGSFTDGDIGNYADDYMGSDPQRNMIYQFNGDLIDESTSSVNGYGQGAPAMGVKYLNQEMAHSGYFTSTASPAQSDPSSAAQFWNYLNGKWRFGDDWVFGGTGYVGSSGSTGILTDHMFTGYDDPMNTATGMIDPGFIWDEATNNNPAGDRRLISTYDHGTLAPGAEFEVHQAIIVGWDSNNVDLFGNLTLMQTIADSVQAFYDNGLDDCNDPFVGITPIENETFSVFPNPTQGAFTIRIPKFSNDLKVEIRDVCGKLILKSTIHASDTDFVLDESAGVYFVTLLGDGYERTVKLMLD